MRKRSWFRGLGVVLWGLAVLVLSASIPSGSLEIPSYRQMLPWLAFMFLWALIYAFLTKISTIVLGLIQWISIAVVFFIATLPGGWQAEAVPWAVLWAAWVMLIWMVPLFLIWALVAGVRGISANSPSK